MISPGPAPLVYRSQHQIWRLPRGKATQLKLDATGRSLAIAFASAAALDAERGTDEKEGRNAEPAGWEPVSCTDLCTRPDGTASDGRDATGKP
jgi:hypothetical protein